MGVFKSFHINLRPVPFQLFLMHEVQESEFGIQSRVGLSPCRFLIGTLAGFDVQVEHTAIGSPLYHPTGRKRLWPGRLL